MSHTLPCENPLIYPPSTRFVDSIARIGQRFAVYAATSPVPLPASGLVISREIRYQCELYLPINELQRLFYRYYRASLSHQPILASTPLYTAQSWADCFALLPAEFQSSPNPARLLQRLLTDAGLHERFIYASFLPTRYNGAGFSRYPQQQDWLRRWAKQVANSFDGRLHCLDAACGSGEGSWELAELLQGCGWQAGRVLIDGWTLDPLEIYAATNRYLPHLPQRQQEYRQFCAALHATGWTQRVRFRSVDLLAGDLPPGDYQLILCNGLLGGPLLQRPDELQATVGRLAGRLRPGGWLLAANRFHGGWQRCVPPQLLAGLFRQAGLVVQQVGDGIAGQRSRPCTR